MTKRRTLNVFHDEMCPTAFGIWSEPFKINA